MTTNFAEKDLSRIKQRQADCNTPLVAPMKPPRLRSKGEISPISNFPPVREYDGGVPDDPTVMEIFSLRREIESLKRDLKASHKKVSRAMEVLYSLRRFLRLGLFEKEWDTHDEFTRRLSSIDGALAYLDDPMGGIEAEEIKLPERWKKRD